MAEDKKTFIQGKMNQDIDDRILPNGEYRSAQNIQVTTSEGSDVGSIQNILGNTKVSNFAPGFSSYDDLETIGCFFDEKNNKIYYFVTNYTCPDPKLTGLVGGDNGPTTAEQADNNTGNLFCGIFVAQDADSTGLPQISLLVQGLFLNFSKTNLITGVNLLENLLFFTDNLNQPRKINVETASLNPNHYDSEDKISVAKFAPFMPALLLEYDTTTLNNNVPTASEPTSSMELSSQNNFPEDFLREKFVRFSYRFRFADGEYSTIAPFTQICFIPKTTSYSITQLQKVFKKGEIYFQDTNGIADGMVNNVTAINLNIILPSKKIKTDLDINAIEILYKESDNNLIRAVDLKDLDDTSSSTGVFQFKYKSTLPYKTLPKDQLTRVYDNVPLAAQAQEIISNRVVYGNYVENRKLPNQPGTAGINFSVGSSAKYDITADFGNSDFNNYYLHKEYPFHSIKQRRTYEIGVVLSDKFGRQSPVLTSTSGVGSVNVSAKDNNFNSSSWDIGSATSVNSSGGVISSVSPGNENYCGDALTITFNQEIPNAYAKGTFIPINNTGLDSIVYANDVYKTIFATDPLLDDSTGSGTGVLLGNLFYYSTIFIPVVGVTDFLYLDSTLQTVLTGYNEVYMHPGFNSTSTTVEIHKISLNLSTGAVEEVSTVSQSIFQSNLLGASTPVLVAAAGSSANITSALTTVTPSQEALNNSFLPELGTVFNLSIVNFGQINLFQVGDYLKGQNTDFVKIVGIQQQSSTPPFDQGLNILTDGPVSLSYKNYTGDLSNPSFNNDTVSVDKYSFYKYNLTPHGWYSYRIVVKQNEQEYYNVYTPGAISFDNDKDEDKTYIPISSDNINKITRDIEFTNTQEIGLSTSKNRVYPKVVPDGFALSKQSDADLLDVISIGTAKEQALKNDNEDVFDFVYESTKNTLMAQLPYGDNTISVGTSVDAGFIGTTKTVAFNASSGTSDIKLKNQGKSLTWTDNSGTSYAVEFQKGNYLKGKFKDLVKIINFEEDTPASNQFVVTCDGAIDPVALGLDKKSTDGDVVVPSSISVRVYEYKYGVQDKISVFETKPFESVLDIYYETSTAGLVHELNEAAAFPSTVKNINFKNIIFSEDTLYFDENGFWTSQTIADLEFLDQFDNQLSFGTANNQIATCEIISQSGIMIDSNGNVENEILVNDFEIILDSDDNLFKIKPLNNNFVYYPEEFPIRYNFEIKVTNVAGEEEIIIVTDLNLENAIPNTSATPNSFSAFATVPEINEDAEPIFEFIDATNGSVISNSQNQLGLFFQDANIGSDFALDFLVGYNSNGDPISTLTPGVETTDFDSSFGEPLFLQRQQILVDSDNIARPEITIDNNTGAISLTNLYRGVFSVNLQIKVIDSTDLELMQGLDTVIGGKSFIHNLSLSINNGLIIVDNIPSFGSTSNLLLQDGTSVDIFNQSSANISSDLSASGGYNDGVEILSIFDNYISKTFNENMQIAQMININNLETDPGVFLYSFVKNGSVSGFGSQATVSSTVQDYVAYFLNIDANGQPIVQKYEKQAGGEPFTGSQVNTANSGYGRSKAYINHWLATENSITTLGDGTFTLALNEDSELDTAEVNTPDKSPGGHIFVTDNGMFGFGDQVVTEKTDIDGKYDINPENSNVFNLRQVQDVDPNEKVWSRDTSFPDGSFGNAPDTVGYFKVYGDGVNVTAGVAKPQDRIDEFQENNTFMFKAQDTITVNDFEYNILFDVASSQSGALAAQLPVLQRVFLCRVANS